MRVQHLFEEKTCTFTCMLSDELSKETIIVDAVDTKLDRDLAIIRSDELIVKWIIETHAHADHKTSAAQLAELTGWKLTASSACDTGTATWQLVDKSNPNFGTYCITAASTPEHTSRSMCFISEENVFTGDSLLINGCGITDFQSGSSEDLYESISSVLFELPDETTVLTRHGYNNKLSSTIGLEKQNNPIFCGKSKSEFVQLMPDLEIARHKRIHESIPANMHSG